ncbi:MAG: SPFH domain-containing protein [Candidatus Poribacteria bacterium]
MRRLFGLQLLAVGALIIFLIVISGCGNHAEVPIGKEGVNEKTAGYRTAGGGIEDRSYPAGQRYKIGSTFSKSKMLLIRNTPFSIAKTLKVRMANWSNLDMQFDVTLTGTIVPGTGYRILRDIGSNWKATILEQPLVNVCQDILGQQTREGLRDRERIGAEIKAAVEERIRQRGKTATECIRVIDVTLNNMDYPDEILIAKAKTATAEYRKQVLEIEKKIAELNGQKDEIVAETINQSYVIEAGTTNRNFLAWQNFQVLKAAMVSDNEITLVIQLDEQGNPTYMVFK